EGDDPLRERALSQPQPELQERCHVVPLTTPSTSLPAGFATERTFPSLLATSVRGCSLSSAGNRSSCVSAGRKTITRSAPASAYVATTPASTGPRKGQTLTVTSLRLRPSTASASSNSLNRSQN